MTSSSTGTGPRLLARFAENCFWMARYMERAENLARILDVNETFARDQLGAQDWLPIVQINADGERFFARHDAATVEAVIDFYMLDRNNPNSIVAAVGAARENARSLRHVISTEMWAHLNVFHGRLAALTPADLALSELSRLCAMIKENCQTHAGITEGTFYRDEGWYFYEIGKQIERADQTTRLLDIKYHRLLPSPGDVGNEVDAGQWNALLRSVAGYHAFRRIHPRGMNPAIVAGFLLFSTAFPRSVAVCAGRVDALLMALETDYGLGGTPAATEALDALCKVLRGGDIERVIADGLHEFLDRTQMRLNTLTDALRVSFFG